MHTHVWGVSAGGEERREAHAVEGAREGARRPRRRRQVGALSAPLPSHLGGPIAVAFGIKGKGAHLIPHEDMFFGYLVGGFRAFW